MIVAETHEPTEAHDRVSHATGRLIDDQVIDLTDVFVARTLDFGAVDIFA
jgi:hypothetical protein